MKASHRLFEGLELEPMRFAAVADDLATSTLVCSLVEALNPSA